MNLGIFAVSTGAFSIGIKYKYDDDNGLLVKPKYSNFKQEILEYQHININQYQKEILPKATAYLGTISIHCKYEDEPITEERLISIILYTDYTSLSAHFTSTFRKSNAFEPIQSTKRRHANYYWMAKILEECRSSHGQRKTSGLIGPFYCGMSVVMSMPQFAIGLHSPTSTSCHIEVAMKFSGQSGIIIQFDNSRGRATMLDGIDVSLVSRFREEDERYENCILLRQICISKLHVIPH